MIAAQSAELLVFFKALADANRLRIIGLLASQPFSVEQISAMLGISASTTSHHLAQLSRAGLVSAEAMSYYSIYRLNEKALEEMARRLLATGTLPALASEVDVGAYDRKVWSNYVNSDGRLRQLPSQRKKLTAILQRLTTLFEPGVRYTEAQVNVILARFHDDVATLRRSLVSEGLMERSAGEYWRRAGN